MGLLSSGTGHNATGAGNTALVPGCLVCVLLATAGSHPSWCSLASLWSPTQQWGCQRMETRVQPPPSQSPVSTDVCFSEQHRNRTWGGVWEAGGSEEAVHAPRAFVWTRLDPLLNAETSGLQEVRGGHGLSASCAHNEAFFSPKAPLHTLFMMTDQAGTVTGTPMFESFCLRALSQRNAWVGVCYIESVEEKQTSLLSKFTTLGWSNDQIDLRQVSKRERLTKFNTYVWEPHIHKSQRPHAQERFRDRKGIKVYNVHWGLQSVIAG